MSLANTLFDDRGRARRKPMAIAAGGMIVLAALGAAAASFAKGIDDPNLQSAWVITTVILFKVPILALAWWVIVRNRDLPTHQPVWDEQETREILARLSEEADKAVHARDADTRLEHLRREAWHVADRSGGATKGEAVEVALRIDRLRSRTGRRVV